MKKTFLCAPLIAAALFLPGCVSEAPPPDSDLSSVQQSGTEASSAPTPQLPVSDNTSDYAEITAAETELGMILYPVLNEKMLNAEDAASANAAFKSAADELSANIGEFLKEHPGATAADIEMYGDFCCAESSLGNGILSVVFTCKRFVGDTSPAVLCFDFNTTTGRKMTYSEVVSSSGFFEEEIGYSVRWYCEKCLEIDNWRNILSSAYSSGRLPEINTETMPEVSESLVSETLEMFGKNADKGVYIDMTGNVFVEAKIPSGITGEYETRLVAVGRNDMDIRRKNDARYDPFFPITPMGCLDAYSAADAVRKSIDFDFEPEFNAEYVESIDGEYAYVICVNADQGDRAAVVGRYAVGALSPKLWRQDHVSGSWELISARAEWLPNTYDAVDKSAIAVVVKNPSAYERWAAAPVDVMAELGTDGRDSDYFMIMAVHDGTRMRFANDTVITLNSGEYILDLCLVDEDERCIGITSIEGEGVFAYSSENFYDGNDILYILNDGRVVL